jgi:hypothetical protein
MLSVSAFLGDCGIIIRRKNCVFVTLGTGYRITNTKCHKNTVVSPDDGPTVA